jgi:hypothetical protein
VEPCGAVVDDFDPLGSVGPGRVGRVLLLLALRDVLVVFHAKALLLLAFIARAEARRDHCSCWCFGAWFGLSHCSR